MTIFTISAVSASENITDDNLAVNESDEVSIDENSLQSSEEEKLDNLQNEEKLNAMHPVEVAFGPKKDIIYLDDWAETSDFAQVYVPEKKGSVKITVEDRIVLYEKNISTFTDSYDPYWGYCFNISVKDIDTYIKEHNVDGKTELKDFITDSSKDFRFIIIDPDKNDTDKNEVLNHLHNVKTEINKTTNKTYIAFYYQNTDPDYQPCYKNLTVIMDGNWTKTNIIKFKIKKAYVEYNEGLGLTIYANGRKINYADWFEGLIHIDEPCTEGDYIHYTLKIGDLVNSEVASDWIWEAREYKLEFITYKIDMDYEGVLYNETLKLNLTVKEPIDSSVTMDPIIFEYGQTGTTTLNLIGATVAKENITVKDHPEAVIDLNNKKVSVSNLTVGSYTLQVITTPINANYKSITRTTEITVNKGIGSFSITDVTFDYEGKGIVEATTTGSNIVVGRIINHPEAAIEINGNIISISNLDAGTYILEIEAVPLENYMLNSNKTNATVTVNKIKSTISLSPVAFDYGKIGTCEVTIKGATVDKENITIYHKGAVIDGAVIDVKNNIISISNLSTELYELKVITTPDGNHISSENTTVIIVSPADANMIIKVNDIEVGQNATVIITTDEKLSGSIDVKLGNITKTGYVKDGKCEVIFESLPLGMYTVVVTLPKTDNFKASNKTATFAVKLDPELKITVSSVYASQKPVITINTLNTFTGTVKVAIESKTYTVNVKNGKGTTTISSLKAGTYKATATITGTNEFKASTKTTTFKVKADVIKLTINKVAVKKSAKKLTIKATLKINGKTVKGKKITFKFNKKTYKATTNSKGIAKIVVKKSVLKKLKTGKKVTYLAKYSTKTAKKTVKVKK